MIASVTRYQIALNLFLNRFLICLSFPKYPNFSTLSKGLLSVFTLWLRPAFCSRDMTMYLVLSVFTSNPTSLPATNKASAFSFRLFTLPPYINTINTNRKLMWIIKYLWFLWTLVMSFSKGKLKSNGIKSHSSLKALLLGTNMSHKCLPEWTLLSVSFKHTFISLISCKGV